MSDHTMLSDSELLALLDDLESDRVERKASDASMDRVREAVCAFANDMPNHGKPGVVFIGANDDGTCARLTIDDDLLLKLSDVRSDGNILPLPTLTVEKRHLRGCDLAVIAVQPSDAPPVRYRGRVWIRVGPRRAIASAEEERRLNERRRAADVPYDLHVVSAATTNDLDTDRFLREYLTVAVSADVLAQNDRSLEQQLASLRFVGGTQEARPTVVGVLAVGKSPADFIPGAYVQFLRIDGRDLTDPIVDEHVLHGAMLDVLRRIDDVLQANIHVAVDVAGQPLEVQRYDYPIAALQQLVRNAVMHRNYETSNAPIRITWFSDRIEIQNPGGPFGQVTHENFGTSGITDYRNPHVAEVMRTLGYVQKFGVGIALARRLLRENGNPEPEFEVTHNHILVKVRSGR